MSHVVKIGTSWDGAPLHPDAATVLELAFAANGDLNVTVNGPFYNSPGDCGGPVGEPFMGLWWVP